MPTVGQVIGENLRRLRTERGLTQDELGRLLGPYPEWGRSHVAAIEAGNRESIELDTVVALAAALDVSVLDLLAGDGPVRLTSRATFTRAGFREVLSKPRRRWTESVALDGKAAGAFLDLLPGERTPADLGAPFQADAEVAQRLGIDPGAVMSAAFVLWGSTLHQERDRRISVMGDMPAGERRVRRGHITRQLTVEIRSQLGIAKE